MSLLVCTYLWRKCKRAIGGGHSMHRTMTRSFAACRVSQARSESSACSYTHKSLRIPGYSVHLSARNSILLSSVSKHRPSKQP